MRVEHSKPVISQPDDFLFGEVRPDHLEATALAQATPSPLGPLSAFTGDWAGNGFNMIFRPNSTTTPTLLPTPVVPPADNVLELNLVEEQLTFSKSLGSVPNRGTTPQGDIFLNGIPYLQVIEDVTVHGERVGIHFEPGLWIHVPATTAPGLGETVTRMASIPHGTTIEAQGTFVTFAGPPPIEPVDITPFTKTGARIKFPSQTATDQTTSRIPQDLTSYIAAGTITQALLDDPNSLLRAHISKQTITETTALIINTAPPPVPFGGGTDNIAFLLGDEAVTTPNAQALKMSAIFWIETVEATLTVPKYHEGHPPLRLKAQPSVPGQQVPTFLVQPPHTLHHPTEIKVTYTQIQYTQTVILVFKGLSWPHVSVNTLVPSSPIVVPPSAFGA
jgi:hypothetical protein